MGIPKNITREFPDYLDRWAIAITYRGSIAHGMYAPSSEPNSIDDKDAMVICVPPLDYYLGLKTFGSRGTVEIKRGEWDIVCYEFLKFIRMLKQGNPNVLMALWLREADFIYKGRFFEELLANRQLFVGRHVYRSFTGYAHGQLHRMTHMAFEGYMGEKRKALVEKHGYDTKNAAHLIRLLRMGIEFLKDGELQVFRHDSAQLLEIKRGEWSLDQVKAEADRLFTVSHQAYLDSTLPQGPDDESISGLATRMLAGSFGLKAIVPMAC